MRYFGTFIAGAGEIIRQVLPGIVELQDGLVIFEGTRANWPFLNNSYELVGRWRVRDVEDLARRVLDTGKPKGFRNMFAVKNQYVAIAPRLRAHFKGPSGQEFLGLVRDDGWGYWGKKVSRADNTRGKGQVARQLAWMLCWLSRPSKADVFWDPFAGSHIIEKVRTGWPYKKMIGTTGDFSLQEVGGVNKIVTDPPWGLYEAEKYQDIDQLYEQFLRVVELKLEIDGLLVVLASRFGHFGEILSRHPKLEVMQRVQILVAGKPATIYKSRLTE